MRATEPIEALLLTGVYGTGKSTLVEEIAETLGDAGVRYAAVDLDWLAWCEVGLEDDAHGAATPVFLRNLEAVVSNFLEAGVRRFLFARSVRDAEALEAIRATLPFPLRVVRVTLPLEEIERRLDTNVTRGRQDDLRRAGEWLEGEWGVGLEDRTIANDREIAVVADEIIAWLGWISTA